MTRLKLLNTKILFDLEYVKRHSTLLIIRNQIEPLCDTNFLLSDVCQPCWQGCEEIGRNIIDRTLQSDLAITIKITNVHTIWLTISLLGIYPTDVYIPMDEMPYD